MDNTRPPGRQGMRRLALLLALPLVLAGCMSDAPEASESAPEAAPASVEAATISADGTPVHLARFATGALVDETRWFNGTFKAEHAANAADALPGLVERAESLVVIDIGDMVPVGVPSRVIGTLEAQMSHGDLDLWIQLPQGEARTGHWDRPYGGYNAFEVGMFHAAPGAVEVMLYYDVLEPVAELPYTLSVRVVADPELLLNGVSTAITLPADARFDVELFGEKRESGSQLADTALVVYDPDDALVGRFPLASGATTIALPAGSPAGEYVFLLSQGGHNARVLVHGAPATLRALGIEWTGGDAVDFDAQGRASWTTEIPRAPILAGIWFTTPNVAHNVEFELAGPAGQLLADRIEWTEPWISGNVEGVADFGGDFGWDSLYGAPGLAAGTYSATVAYDRAAGAQPAQGMIFYGLYVR